MTNEFDTLVDQTTEAKRLIIGFMRYLRRKDR